MSENSITFIIFCWIDAVGAGAPLSVPGVSELTVLGQSASRFNTGAVDIDLPCSHETAWFK